MTALLSKAEAASMLKISEKTLSRIMQRGEITYRKISRTPMFAEDDIEAYLRAVAVPARRRVAEFVPKAEQVQRGRPRNTVVSEYIPGMKVV